MKPSIKIIILAVILTLMTGCSAERRIQRIVRNHPELIEVKMRTLDTLLTVHGYTEQALVPMATLQKGETCTEHTEHGTFVISVNDTGDSVSVNFIADTQQIRFQDTLKYRQVVLPEPEDKKKGDITFWHRITEWISFLAIGAVLALYFTFKYFKKQ